MALFEPTQSEGKVVGDIFKDRGQGLASGPTDEALEGSAKESQGTGTVGVLQQTFIFAPTSVPLPMAAFTAPVRLDELGHRRRVFLTLVPAANKVSGEIFAGRLNGIFGNFLMSSVVAGS